MSDDQVGQAPASVDGGTPDGLEALTEEVLPALVARLRASRLGELEVRNDGWRVRLRRDPAATARPAAGGAASAADGESESPAGSVVRSTAVGYFIPAPGLLVGATVQSGDLLGTIDVLGIAQEVTAPAAGLVARVLAEDGQAVEYGQVLADIDPLEVDFGDEIAVGA